MTAGLKRRCACGEAWGCDRPHPDLAPTSPTEGWLYTEVERLGEAVRGSDVTPRQLVLKLNAQGYAIDPKGYRSSKGSGAKTFTGDR